MHRRLAHLFIEPYRLFFAMGAPYAALAMAVWSGWLLAPEHLPLSWSQPATRVHGHLMLYGVFGFYVFGFILTAFPRWVSRPFLARPKLILLFGLLSGAEIALVSAALGSGRLALGLAGILQTAAYALLAAFLILEYRASRANAVGDDPNGKQVRIVLSALLFAALGAALFHLGLLFPNHPGLLSASLEIGVYLYLLLLVVAITYRIVPFFASRAVPGYGGSRGGKLLAIVPHLLYVRVFASLIVGSTGPGCYVVWGLDLAIGIVLAAEWRRWLSRTIVQAPMLLILFVGLFWILAFFGFSALEIGHHLAHPGISVAPILRTPALHALLVGAFGTLVLAISTRVVRGHGGLPIKADAVLLVSLLLLEASAVMRVGLASLAVLLPSLAKTGFYVAGVPWTLAFLLWSIRHLPLLVLPKQGE